jgi:hypothetical protein
VKGPHQLHLFVQKMSDLTEQAEGCKTLD